MDVVPARGQSNNRTPSQRPYPRGQVRQSRGAAEAAERRGAGADTGGERGADANKPRRRVHESPGPREAAVLRENEQRRGGRRSREGEALARIEAEPGGSQQPGSVRQRGRRRRPPRGPAPSARALRVP